MTALSRFASAAAPRNRSFTAWAGKFFRKRSGAQNVRLGFQKVGVPLQPTLDHLDQGFSGGSRRRAGSKLADRVALRENVRNGAHIAPASQPAGGIGQLNGRAARLERLTVDDRLGPGRRWSEHGQGHDKAQEFSGHGASNPT